MSESINLSTRADASGDADEREPRSARPGFPLRLAVGLALVGVSWGLYWSMLTVWSHALFCGLWLGYIITVDGLVHRRTGTSLLDRGPGTFALAFAVSIPFWWVFEWCNWRLHNWSYTLPLPMNRATDIVMSSLTFSTVLPALFETAELLRSTRCFRGPRPARRRSPSRAAAWSVAGLGVVALAATLLFPRQLFPLVWIAPLLMLDPVNARAGRSSLWGQTAESRWRLPLLLAASGLVCGFFWEFWNSRPVGARWQYFVPDFLSHPHLFAMPLPGYLGYPPFAASAYAFYHLVCGLIAPRAEAAPDLG